MGKPTLLKNVINNIYNHVTHLMNLFFCRFFLGSDCLLPDIFVTECFYSVEIRKTVHSSLPLPDQQVERCARSDPCGDFPPRFQRVPPNRRCLACRDSFLHLGLKDVIPVLHAPVHLDRLCLLAFQAYVCLIWAISCRRVWNLQDSERQRGELFLFWGLVEMARRGLDRHCTRGAKVKGFHPIVRQSHKAQSNLCGVLGSCWLMWA